MDDELSVSLDDRGENSTELSSTSGGSSQKFTLRVRGFGVYCVCDQRLWVYRCGNVPGLIRHLKLCSVVKNAKDLPFTKLFKDAELRLVSSIEQMPAMAILDAGMRHFCTDRTCHNCVTPFSNRFVALRHSQGKRLRNHVSEMAAAVSDGLIIMRKDVLNGIRKSALAPSVEPVISAGGPGIGTITPQQMVLANDSDDHQSSQLNRRLHSGSIVSTPGPVSASINDASSSTSTMLPLVTPGPHTPFISGGNTDVNLQSRTGGVDYSDAQIAILRGIKVRRGNDGDAITDGEADAAQGLLRMVGYQEPSPTKVILPERKEMLTADEIVQRYLPAGRDQVIYCKLLSAFGTRFATIEEFEASITAGILAVSPKDLPDIEGGNQRSVWILVAEQWLLLQRDIIDKSSAAHKALVMNFSQNVALDGDGDKNYRTEALFSLPRKLESWKYELKFFIAFLYSREMKDNINVRISSTYDDAVRASSNDEDKLAIIKLNISSILCWTLNYDRRDSSSEVGSLIEHFLAIRCFTTNKEGKLEIRSAEAIKKTYYSFIGVTRTAILSKVVAETRWLESECTKYIREVTGST